MNKEALQDYFRWLRNRWVRLGISIVVAVVMILNDQGEWAVWVGGGIGVVLFFFILWLYGDVPGK
ncbi:MAG TPA: hypothetical protein VG737_14990 [Cyclobacteriaceae bacterium]|nr:hypothetical protein [Cyclobacteriaceae bacterium]